MKKILLSLTLSLFAVVALAQYPEISVTDLQFVSQADLANCSDSSAYQGDTVIVVGRAIHDGNLTELSSGSVQGGYRPGLWIVDTANNSAMDPFAAVQVHGVYDDAQGNTLPVNELDNITAGQVIKIVGVVGGFGGDTQFQPINNNAGSIAAGNAIEFISLSGPAPQAKLITDLGQINDDSRVNQLETGEQWEGAFIELQNVTVTSVNFFSGGSRVSFDIVDQNGNQMNVSDRFIVQKLASHTPVNAQSPATNDFNAPPVGTVYSSLKGIVIHSENGCTGGNGRGYELNPFDDSHYSVGVAPPNISNVDRTPTIPNSSQDAEVICNISDFDGTVDRAELFYSTTPTNPGSFTSVTMTLVSGTTDEYEATIPAQSNNTLVGYYIEAEDNSGNVTSYPFTPAAASNQNVEIYTVRDNGATIMDIQFVLDPDAEDASPYTGSEITVTGVVTSSTKPFDLGYVYIQDTTASEYAGIALTGNSDLITLFRGDVVEVTGTVQENFGFTILNVSDVVALGECGNVEPIYIDPSDAALYTDDAMEKYESMLIGLVNPNAGSPMVIDEEDEGFGEYSVASSTGAAESTRVLAGRQAGSASSSLYVSLVTDGFYYTNDGQMEVDTVITEQGMEIDTVVGLMHYSFSNYKLFPRNNDDIVGLTDAMGNAIDLAETNLTECTEEDPGTFVNENGQSIEYALFPNPAKDQVTLLFSDIQTELNVNIVDLTGREVYRATLNNQAHVVNTNAFESGVYLVRIADEAGKTLSVKKLIVN